MFEKEAENYADKQIGCGDGYYEWTDVKQSFKDGAEFGYKYKENEWHYTKCELPPEDVPLLCVRGGKIYVAWYYNGIYHDSRCCQVKKPYAWKEIVLPELKESK